MKYDLVSQCQQLNSEYIDQVYQLEEICFGGNKLSIDDFKKELQLKKDLYSLLLFDNQRLIAYKIGYQDRVGRFYSWVGGVHPEYQRQGLAQFLMAKQHSYLVESRYQFVRTQTSNHFKGMLILNLKMGFDITGTFTNPSGVTRIILDKKLT